MGIRQLIKDNELDKPIWERENYGLKPKTYKKKPLKAAHRIGLPD